MKLTANERYLLEIICRLRGSAYDSWGRLNAIRTKRETVRQAAPKDELDGLLAELQGTVHTDISYGLGAHLPHPSDPQLSSELKHKLITRHRRAMKRGKSLKSVYDLIHKKER